MAGYDVVVIGAGPAGSVVALRAAECGLDVLLVDRAKFPRYKVCGCSLNGRALAALREVGLGDLVPDLGGRRLKRVEVRTPAGHASLGLSGSFSVSRRCFDDALVSRARAAGATFDDGVGATLSDVEGNSRVVCLTTRGGQTSRVRARVVVVADGLSGTALRGNRDSGVVVDPASRIGAGTLVAEAPGEYEDDVIRLACGRGGYVGTVRLEDRSLDVAAALDRGFVLRMGSVGAAASRILDDACMPLIPSIAGLPWRGTPALTRRRPMVAGERYFVVGDAAGYVEPFTGEGIAWAVEGAVALAEWIPRAVSRWEHGFVLGWTRRHRSLTRRRQWGCRAVSALLRRPRLTRGAVRLIGRAPGIAAPLVRRLTQPLSG